MTMYAYKTDDGGNYRLGHKLYATRHVVHFPVYLGSCKPDYDVGLFGYVDLVCGSQEILPKQTPVTNSMVALYAKVRGHNQCSYSAYGACSGCSKENNYYTKD